MERNIKTLVRDDFENNMIDDGDNIERKIIREEI